MTDQCLNCDLRGDLVKCKAAECFHHENWYALEQQKIIDELQERIVNGNMAIIDLRASLRTCVTSSNGALEQYKEFKI